jgi:hypothetical protein
MFTVFFGGLILAPSPSSEQSAMLNRRIYIYAVLTSCLVVAAVGGIIILGRIKTDCSKFGVLCPKCGLNLYSQRRLLLGGAGTRETGICPHCHYQLVDETSC